ncbi:AraC family transcriptional regulator [Mycolicibacterium sp. XJ870]
MIYTSRTPAAPLREYVDHLWCITDGPATAERILPSGTTELVINLGDDAIHIVKDPAGQHLSGAAVSGPYRCSFDIDARRHAAMVGVHFKPDGTQAILGVPPLELLDRHIDLAELWHSEADTLRSRVCEATSASERIALIESALLTRLRTDHPAPAAMTDIVKALEPGCTHPPMEAMARRAGLSHRTFIEAFSARVGMTPKRFFRVRRFRRAHHAVGSAQSPDWSRFAVEHGYADQSHLIREFQDFSGMTPADYLRRRTRVAKDDHIALEP